MRGLPGPRLDKPVRRLALRWTVAAFVTIAAFAAATWICGALVLPALKMHDAAVRWGVAGGLGVAVAALAALWGHSYATTEPQPGGAPPAHPAPTTSSSGGATRNTIRGGTFQKPVIQGRDVTAINTTGPQPASPPPQPHQAAPSTPTASGSGDTHSTINGGLFHGPVIQGRDFGTVNLNNPTPHTDPPVPTDDQPGKE